MSTMMNPVGPQSPGVYWLRRALVLVVVLAVVVGVVWLIGGRGSDAGTPAAAPASSQNPTARATPSAPETRTPDPTGSASATGAKTTLTDCKNSAIKVTASTDAASYQVGSTPRLRMQITNSSAQACTRDVGAAANELIVNLGDSKFWSSDDCSPGGKSDVVTLEAGNSYSVSLSWPGRASAPNCPAGQPAAKAGSYNLVGRNGDVVSKPEPFSLT